MKPALYSYGFLLFVLILLSIPLVTFVGEADAETISASGCSVSNAGYLSDLAREYEKLTGVKVFVRGGGSVAGLEDLRSGKVDFAASCRKRTTGDPVDIEFVQVAWDALVFVVHRSNPIGNITIESARSIYLGKITNWKQLNGNDVPINLFISKPQMGLSGVESSTKELLLKGQDIPGTPNALSLVSSAIVEQMVEKTPGGFAVTGFSSAQKRELKMLRVNGVYPTKGNIVKKLYPFRRPLYILVPPKPKPEVKRFIKFVLSTEGQRLISSLGVISLMEVK